MKTSDRVERRSTRTTRESLELAGEQLLPLDLHHTASCACLRLTLASPPRHLPSPLPAANPLQEAPTRRLSRPSRSHHFFIRTMSRQ